MKLQSAVLHGPAPLPRALEIHGLIREGGVPRYFGLVYLGLHLALLALPLVDFSWTFVIAGLLLLQIRGFCLSAGNHRLLAHRSYKTSRWFQFLLAAGACTALRGGPLWWVAHHRHHHGHSDTDDDIFTPAKGFWWSYGLWLFSGRFEETNYSMVRDLARFPELRWLNRLWWMPTLILVSAIAWLGGWQALVAVYCLSTVILLHTLAMIDALNHLIGWQRFDTQDQSKNNALVAFFCNGEGWHNNHHHYPASARYGFFSGETDSTYSVIYFLKIVGMVWDIKLPPASVLSANLHPLPESVGAASKSHISDAAPTPVPVAANP